MPTRAEALAVSYLEKDVKSLRMKLARLEKRLKAQDAEVARLKQQARLSAKGAAQARELTKEMARLSRDHAIHLEIIEDQRRRIDQKRIATTPEKILEQAVTTARGLLPVTTERVKVMFRGKAGLAESVRLLLLAYDDAMRVAQRAVGTPPGKSTEHARGE